MLNASVLAVLNRICQSVLFVLVSVLQEAGGGGGGEENGTMAERRMRLSVKVPPNPRRARREDSCNIHSRIFTKGFSTNVLYTLWCVLEIFQITGSVYLCTIRRVSKRTQRT